MASIYCQELIRNTKLLCENYIGEILQKADVRSKMPKEKVEAQLILEKQKLNDKININKNKDKD